MNQAINNFIKAALEEDMSSIGDITSMATIPTRQTGIAHFIVKEDCTIAGIEMAKAIANNVDPSLVISFNINDGDKINQQSIVGFIEGKIQSILIAERLMLNCMQRMSGIATKVAFLIHLIKHYPAKILDTRKTTPNFRLAEKWAVKIGGGLNHRFGLYDMILIKDNHIKAAGSIQQVLSNTTEYCKTHSLSVPVVIEVKNKTEFIEVLQFDIVSRILLDNMTPKMILEIVQINQHKKPLEVSGGVHQGNIVAYAETGVDYISIGDITHHIQSIDISLKII